jgi:hypothetical protein
MKKKHRHEIFCMKESYLLGKGFWFVKKEKFTSGEGCPEAPEEYLFFLGKCSKGMPLERS